MILRIISLIILILIPYILLGFSNSQPGSFFEFNPLAFVNKGLFIVLEIIVILAALNLFLTENFEAFQDSDKVIMKDFLSENSQISTLTSPKEVSDFLLQYANRFRSNYQHRLNVTDFANWLALPNSLFAGEKVYLLDIVNGVKMDNLNIAAYNLVSRYIQSKAQSSETSEEMKQDLKQMLLSLHEFRKQSLEAKLQSPPQTQLQNNIQNTQSENINNQNLTKNSLQNKNSNENTQKTT